MTLPTKMSPPPHSLQNHFLFSPRRPSAQNPQAEPLIKYQKETQSHKHHTKSKQKSNTKTSIHKIQKETPQKDNPKQSIKPHQLENTPTQTAVQIHPESAQTPLKTHTPQNASTFSPKRKCISLQTPKSLLPNAKAFHLKRKPVFRPKIPKNKKNTPPDSPKPLHFAPSHPLQKPSERGSLSKLPRKSPQKQNQKDTKIPTQAAKRSQTAQI